MTPNKTIEVGSYRQPEHYAIHGGATSFYIWVRGRGERGSACRWIKGNSALYHSLKALAQKDKPAFVNLAKRTHEEFQ